MKDTRRYITSHILAALGLILVIAIYPDIFSRPSADNLVDLTGLSAAALMIGILMSIVGLTMCQVLIIKMLLSQGASLLKNKEFMAATVTFCIMGYFYKNINFLMLLSLVVILVTCFINCTRSSLKTNGIPK